MSERGERGQNGASIGSIDAFVLLPACFVGRGVLSPCAYMGERHGSWLMDTWLCLLERMCFAVYGMARSLSRYIPAMKGVSYYA